MTGLLWFGVGWVVGIATVLAPIGVAWWQYERRWVRKERVRERWRK